MHSIRIAAMAGLALLASGCAAPSGPVPIGPDTYMLAKQGGMMTWDGGSVKAELYKEAGAFCAQQGKQLMGSGGTSADSGFGTYATAEIQFRCLAKDDPDLKRPADRQASEINLRVR